MDRILFLNVGSMSKYQGLKGDAIKGGGKNIALHGYGHEIFNFKQFQGRMYGFGHAPHDSIRLEKLGAAKGADRVDGVLVVWVAKSHVVGWYRNATVFRKLRHPPKHSRRKYKGDPMKYNVTARAQDCTLLDRDGRPFPVPRARERKNGMGRYLWYADGPNNKQFRAKVLRYVENGGKLPISRGLGTRQLKKGGSPHQVDLFKKQKIERYAIEIAEKHWQGLKYLVESVERDNVGWDLYATPPTPGLQLRVEVKGLSGHEIQVELTPNEYAMMRKHKDSYRVCVVTNCLKKHKRCLFVFAYDDSIGKWTDGDDRPLQVQEVKSARLCLAD